MGNFFALKKKDRDSHLGLYIRLDEKAAEELIKVSIRTMSLRFIVPFVKLLLAAKEALF